MKKLLVSLLLLTSLPVLAQDDVTLMAILSNNIFKAGERRDIEVKIANNSGQSLKGKTLIWSLGNMEGDMTIPDGEGLITVGTIPFVAPILHTRCDLLLYLFIYDTNYRNTYKVWIYPS